MSTKKQKKPDKNEIAYKSGKKYRRKLARRNKILMTILINVLTLLLFVLSSWGFCSWLFPPLTDENTDTIEGYCVSVDSKTRKVGTTRATYYFITMDTGEKFCIGPEGKRHVDKDSLIQNYKNSPMTVTYSTIMELEGVPRLLSLQDSQRVYLDLSDSKFVLFGNCFAICLFHGFLWILIAVVTFLDLSLYLIRKKYNQEVY